MAGGAAPKTHEPQEPRVQTEEKPGRSSVQVGRELKMLPKSLQTISTYEETDVVIQSIIISILKVIL